MNAEAVERQRLDSLREVFDSLSDPRHAKGIRHPVASVLALCVIGLLSGCENPAQIEHFGKEHPEILAWLGFREPRRPRRRDLRGMIRAPSNDTISRVLAAVDQEQFNRAMAGWISRAMGNGAKAAIDGKCLRGSQDYVVSVFVNDLGQVVWQEQVDGKDNEFSAMERRLPAMLECLGRIGLFTADAALCHKEIAQLVTDSKRDYLLQLKSPHDTDVAIARDKIGQFSGHVKPAAQTVEKRGVQEGARS